MISSTIIDLKDDRKAILDVLRKYPFVHPIGAFPILYPVPGVTPEIGTIQMARDCDLFILILGGRYGYVTPHNKSATEIEFEAAYFSDPTKILVFVKDVPHIEPAQRVFIQKVLDYTRGYWKHKYKTPEELKNIFENAFNTWISKRIHGYASKPIEFKFVYLVLDALSQYHVEIEYQVTKSDIGFSVKNNEKKEYVLYVSKDEIRQNFWRALDEVVSKLLTFLYYSQINNV
ncbi:hypothetical protein OCC_02089 [Thermococcus litoralis DSM 5473]|uniref:DUF4062 domain-containing protein n=2 Tax=Thermococcus litoralis TaxID=2265 RepID=H3ZJQ6_THELN|nr:hypothetical protein OCC_02089 [Thermococcus litoralis DSM 5473]